MPPLQRIFGFSLAASARLPPFSRAGLTRGGGFAFYSLPSQPSVFSLASASLALRAEQRRYVRTSNVSTAASPPKGGATCTTPSNAVVASSRLQGLAFVASFGAMIVTRASTATVSIARAVALDSGLGPLAIFVCVLFGLGLFILSVAKIIVNERRHAAQYALRSRAKRRCVEAHNAEEFKSVVLQQSKKEANEEGATNVGNYPRISEVHPMLDPIARLSGVIALDIGQFNSPATNARIANESPIFDPAIGVVFDPAIQDTSDALPSAAIDSSSRGALMKSIAALPTNHFLSFIVGGLPQLHQNRRAASSSAVETKPVTASDGSQQTAPLSSAADHSSGRLLALERTVEVYQFEERVAQRQTDTEPMVFAYEPKWSAEPLTFTNPASHRVLLAADFEDYDAADVDAAASSKKKKREGFVSYVFKSHADKTIVPFPFPRVALKGSRMVPGKDNGVASTQLPPLPRLLDGHLVLRGKSEARQSLLSTAVKFCPAEGAVKLWLRPKGGETKKGSDDHLNFAPAPLHTLSFDNAALESGEVLPWEPLDLRSLTAASSEALDRRLRGDAAALLTVRTEYVRHEVPTFLGFFTKKAELLKVGGFGGGGGAESAEKDSGVSVLLAQIQSESGGKRAAAIHQALLAVQAEANQLRNNDPLSLDTSPVKNWSSDPPAELLLPPRQTLRVSGCGTYLTTAVSDDAKDLRIGDVRIRYNCIRAAAVTVIGAVADDDKAATSRVNGSGSGGTGGGLIPRLPFFSSNTRVRRSAGLACRPRPLHMPYRLQPWTYEAYLNELERTNRLSPEGRGAYSMSREAKMPSLATAVVNKTAESAHTAIYASLADVRGAKSSSGGEPLLPTGQRIEKALFSALAFVPSPEVMVPRWAMRSAEESSHDRLPIAVLCASTNREDASATYLFRKHWWRDECNTWGQRYLGFLSMQMALSLSASLAVPLPATVVGVGCSIAALAVWGQTIVHAQIELRQHALELRRLEGGVSERDIEQQVFAAQRGTSG